MPTNPGVLGDKKLRWRNEFKPSLGEPFNPLENEMIYKIFGPVEAPKQEGTG